MLSLIPNLKVNPGYNFDLTTYCKNIEIRIIVIYVLLLIPLVFNKVDPNKFILKKLMSKHF